MLDPDPEPEAETSPFLAFNKLVVAVLGLRSVVLKSNKTGAFPVSTPVVAADLDDLLVFNAAVVGMTDVVTYP